MHWTRKTIYTLLTIFILSYFLYFYIQNIFLPVQFKRFVIARAREYLHRNVTIDKIHFSPLSGFVVRNLTVYQKDDPERVFLQADEVTFHVLLAPVFQRKIILIPSMRLNGPFVQITREETARWNFSDLAEAQKSPQAKSSWTIAPRKIIVKNGEIAYTDQTVPESFHEVISDIELDARFSLNKIVRFTLQGKIPRRESTVNIKGNYYLESRKLSARVIAERVALAQYLSLIPLPQDTHFQDGIITTLDLNLNWERDGLQAQGSAAIDKMDVELAGGKKIVTSARATDVSLTRQDGRWSASGHLESDSTFITFAQGRSLNGKISADIKSLDISARGMSAQGSLILEETRVVTGENKGARAQTFRADDFVMRNDERGIRLQTALHVEGLDATFSADRKLRGDLTTQKTKLAFDQGKLGILSDLQLSNGRFGWGQEKYLQAELKSQQTLLVCKDGGCQVKADLGLKNAHLQLTPQMAMEGDPEGNLTYQYDPNGQDTKYSYSGELRFADAVLKDVPYVQKIEKMRGTVQIETNRLASDQFTFQAQGTDILLSGSLINFSRPVLNVRAKTDNLDLQKLFTAFPVLAEKINIIPTGTAAVTASYIGDVQNPAAADVRFNAKFQDAAITSPQISGEPSGITGELDYQKDLIVWKNIQGLYQNKQYTLNGQFADFSRPTVDVQVASQDLNASAQFKVLNQAFQIVFLTGKYFDSSVDIRGDVHLLEGNEPDMDIRGTFTLSLEDLSAFSAAFKDRLAKLQPVGTFSGEGLFKGRPKNWQDWDLTFTARAPTVSLNGFHLDDGVIEYAQRDRHVSKCNLTGRVYNGNLNLISSVDLAQDEPIARLTGSLEGLDLAVLRESNLPKNEFLAGRLSALVNLSGDPTSPTRWKGAGSLSVTQGHLFRWNILDGLPEVLLIPEFKDVVFTDGQANFTVADGKITTADATMNSSSISLKGQGWIDLEGNINFDIAPTFGELVAAESQSLKKIPSLLLSQGDYVSIKLTGTLRNPQYKVQTLPFKILEKTTDVLKEGLKEGIGTILKEIF